jgi:hypothetical protein
MQGTGLLCHCQRSEESIVFYPKKVNRNKIVILFQCRLVNEFSVLVSLVFLSYLFFIRVSKRSTKRHQKHFSMKIQADSPGCFTGKIFKLVHYVISCCFTIFRFLVTTWVTPYVPLQDYHQSTNNKLYKELLSLYLQ